MVKLVIGALCTPPPRCAASTLAGELASQQCIFSISNRPLERSSLLHHQAVLQAPARTMAPRARARHTAAAPQLPLQDLPDEVLIAMFGKLELWERCERVQRCRGLAWAPRQGSPRWSQSIRPVHDRRAQIGGQPRPHPASHSPPARRPAGTAASPWTAAAGPSSSTAGSSCAALTSASLAGVLKTQ